MAGPGGSGRTALPRGNRPKSERTQRDMSLQFICYSKCSTCKNARDYLDAEGVDYQVREIREQNPTAAELAQWHRRSGLPLKRFFNTSGLQYKALGLKDRLPQMTEEQQLELLSSDGMLVKRPLLVGEDLVLVGFRRSEWDEKLK